MHTPAAGDCMRKSFMAPTLLIFKPHYYFSDSIRMEMKREQLLKSMNNSDSGTKRNEYLLEQINYHQKTPPLFDLFILQTDDLYQRSNNYALKHGNWKLQNSFQSGELNFEMRSAKY
jgi:hypothetical protein